MYSIAPTRQDLHHFSSAAVAAMPTYTYLKQFFIRENPFFFSYATTKYNRSFAYTRISTIPFIAAQITLCHKLDTLCKKSGLSEAGSIALSAGITGTASLVAIQTFGQNMVRWPSNLHFVYCGIQGNYGAPQPGIDIKFRRLIWKQECATLLGVRMAEPLATYTKQYCGEQKFIDYLTSYVSGGLGGCLSYPSKKSMAYIFQFEKPTPQVTFSNRVHASACFSLFYHCISKYLDKK